MRNEEETLDREIERLAELFDRENGLLMPQAQEPEEEELLELDPEELDLEELDDWDEEPAHTEIYYLDENNNFVPEEAVKCVIRKTDADGNLLQETWCYRQEEEPEEIDDGHTFEAVYLDADGKEVDEAAATHVLFREYKDGQLLHEDRYDLVKNEENFLCL